MQALLIKRDGAVKFHAVTYRTTGNYSRGGPDPVIQVPLKPEMSAGATFDPNALVKVEVEIYELIAITHETNIAIYEQRR